MTIHYPYRPQRTTKRKITFDGLGKFDWAGAIGTAVSAYTGQPNALNNPQAQINAALAPPVTINQQAPMGPPPPLATPWFKKPMTFVVGGLAVVTLGLVFLRGRQRRRK